MKANQTSRRNGIQDILCPFTNLFISQGSGYFGGTYSHQGTRAIDVINGDGSRAPYYAPFDCVAIEVYPTYGQTLWYSKEKVRFTDGTIDYCSFVTVHDNTINFGKGYEAKQGEQIGNMGDAGNATGVHCHIEFAKGHDSWVQNQYGNWGWQNAIEFEEACFMDCTNMLSGVAEWKYLKDVIVENVDALIQTINELNEQIDTMQKSFLQDVEIFEEQNRILQDEIVTKDKKILELKNDLIKLENGELQFSELCHFGKLYLCVRKDFK